MAALPTSHPNGEGTPNITAPLIVHSDVEKQVAASAAECRKKWPIRSREISKDTKITEYWDLKNVHPHGDDFLRAVLAELVRLQREDVKRFAKAWIKNHPTEFQAMTVDTLEPFGYTTAEKDLHGHRFLDDVVAELKIIKFGHTTPAVGIVGDTLIDGMGPSVQNPYWGMPMQSGPGYVEAYGYPVQACGYPAEPCVCPVAPYAAQVPYGLQPVEYGMPESESSYAFGGYPAYMAYPAHYDETGVFYPPGVYQTQAMDTQGAGEYLPGLPLPYHGLMSPDTAFIMEITDEPLALENAGNGYIQESPVVVYSQHVDALAMTEQVPSQLQATAPEFVPMHSPSSSTAVASVSAEEIPYDDAPVLGASEAPIIPDVPFQSEGEEDGDFSVRPRLEWLDLAEATRPDIEDREIRFSLAVAPVSEPEDTTVDYEDAVVEAVKHVAPVIEAVEHVAPAAEAVEDVAPVLETVEDVAPVLAVVEDVAPALAAAEDVAPVCPAVEGVAPDLATADLLLPSCEQPDEDQVIAHGSSIQTVDEQESAKEIAGEEIKPTASAESQSSTLVGDVAFSKPTFKRGKRTKPDKSKSIKEKVAESGSPQPTVGSPSQLLHARSSSTENGTGSVPVTSRKMARKLKKMRLVVLAKEVDVVGTTETTGSESNEQAESAVVAEEVSTTQEFQRERSLSVVSSTSNMASAESNGQSEAEEFQSAIRSPPSEIDVAEPDRVAIAKAESVEITSESIELETAAGKPTPANSAACNGSQQSSDGAAPCDFASRYDESLRTGRKLEDIVLETLRLSDQSRAASASSVPSNGERSTDSSRPLSREDSQSGSDFAARYDESLRTGRKFEDVVFETLRLSSLSRTASSEPSKAGSVPSAQASQPVSRTGSQGGADFAALFDQSRQTGLSLEEMLRSALRASSGNSVPTVSHSSHNSVSSAAAAAAMAADPAILDIRVSAPSAAAVPRITPPFMAAPIAAAALKAADPAILDIHVSAPRVQAIPPMMLPFAAGPIAAAAMAADPAILDVRVSAPAAHAIIPRTVVPVFNVPVAAASAVKAAQPFIANIREAPQPVEAVSRPMGPVCASPDGAPIIVTRLPPAPAPVAPAAAASSSSSAKNGRAVIVPAVPYIPNLIRKKA